MPTLLLFFLTLVGPSSGPALPAAAQAGQRVVSALPAKESERVSGKVGEDMVAVPDATTSAEDRTTPGFQTKTEGRTVKAPAAPADPEQAGQSEAAAAVDAGAVERTEILPGKTLGVSGLGGAAKTTNRGGTAPGAGE